MSTKIWTRIVTFTVDRDLEMGIVVYPTKEAAYAAARKHGGIALPVDSADLKQLFTTQEFSVEGVTQGSLSAILREHCEDSDDCAIFAENSLSVDSLSLERHLAPEFVKVGDHEEMIHVTEFGPEARAWFKVLEAELGAFVHIE